MPQKETESLRRRPYSLTRGWDAPENRITALSPSSSTEEGLRCPRIVLNELAIRIVALSSKCLADSATRVDAVVDEGLECPRKMMMKIDCTTRRYL